MYINHNTLPIEGYSIPGNSQLSTLPDRMYFREHLNMRRKHNRPDVPSFSSESSTQSSIQDFTTHHSQNSSLEWVLAD